jgi:hypothetical protein
MPRPRLQTAILLLAATLAPSAARADDAASQAAAQELFDAGRKLMDKGDYAAACPKLAASAKLDAGAGTLLNLAACYEKAGQTASAWVTYKDAAAAATSSGRKDWATKAGQKATALEGKLSRLRIELAGPAPEGLRVSRDDATVNAAELGLGIPVDPGARRVSASAPGFEPFSATVEVPADGGVVTVNVPALKPLPAAPNPPPAAPPAAAPKPAPAAPAAADPGATQRWVGVGVAVLGGVGVGLGSFLGLSAKSTYDDALDSQCDAARVCSPEGAASVEDARGTATLSTVLFIAGGAALAGGVVLYFTAPDGTTELGLAAQAGPHAASFGVKGAF